ncbi:hypothetical protein TraAM80_05774 [Trypanosoma rangeli]|uniref:Uncharacterized protein n=1 Tax=Trypanosoma rangeli TaxID=5698 RepID=A0A3R7KY62_TRYRA|nr:uncharacterized protein TraAM80_05774 [Trypanosoma rangeli]RNF03675.1 hypothetical protein TraAM80_05774 [Trypanosoma rangeli]|eukprot:RNF03675.1 hypothetical protein TraAM80_05774 [Trypanosoma rangeli]
MPGDRRLTNTCEAATVSARRWLCGWRNGRRRAPRGGQVAARPKFCFATIIGKSIRVRIAVHHEARRAPAPQVALGAPPAPRRKSPGPPPAVSKTRTEFCCYGEARWSGASPMRSGGAGRGGTPQEPATANGKRAAWGTVAICRPAAAPLQTLLWTPTRGGGP